MLLSMRMKAVASMVSVGYTVADIGTDHAYIPIYLVSEGIAPQALAMDVRTGPLHSAEKNIERYALTDRIKTRLSDGMDELKNGEARSVIISGMGGMLIIDILKRGLKKQTQVKEYILQPQSDAELLRRYLYENEMKITDEKILLEDGKYYTLMKAVKSADIPYSEDPGYRDDADFKYGKILIDRGDELLKEYLIKRREKFQAICMGLSEGKSKGQKERYGELLRELFIIEDTISRRMNIHKA